MAAVIMHSSCIPEVILLVAADSNLCLQICSNPSPLHNRENVLHFIRITN